MNVILLKVTFWILLAKTKSDISDIKETKVKNINYISNVYNDNIELMNVLVKPEKLIMRSSIDESSMLRWNIPNTVDNWAFDIQFNEPNLKSSEKASLYLFYTKENPIIGAFKGAHSTFHGLGAGIEFEGKNVELGYTVNKGTDYFSMEDIFVRHYSLNPRRFKSLKNFRMKVICTKKNFKIELYNEGELLYDNFKFFKSEDVEYSKGGYFFGIFAEYKNVSSGKAIEILGAQLYEREESKDYSIFASNMKKYLASPPNKSDILHPNEDIQNIIYKTHLLIENTTKMLGELPDTTLKTAENELKKELDMLLDKVDKLNIMQRHQKPDSNKKMNTNDLDNKIKRLFKTVSDIEFEVERAKTKIQGVSYFNILVYLFSGLSLFLMISEELKIRWENKTKRI